MLPNIATPTMNDTIVDTEKVGQPIGHEAVESRAKLLPIGAQRHHSFFVYIPVSADVEEIEAVWIEEEDPRVNPIGAKGIGEIGIVGTAAAIANAVHHATGIRIRDLPIRPDKLIGAQA